MKFSTLTSAALIIILTFSSCSKEAENKVEYDYKCVKGKIVRWDCSAAIIEIQTPGLNIGDAIWKDYHGHKLANIVYGTYTNVVAAINVCSIAMELNNRPVGDIIYFDLGIADTSKNYDPEDCYYCQATVDDSPDSNPVFIGNISYQSCEYAPIKR